jgi:DNA polymerase III subunit chi
MTEVAFHFNAPDKLGYACRLVRKAVGSAAQVVVTGESGLLGQLDVALWTFQPLEFIAHCREPGAAPAVLRASPVVLTGAPRSAPHHEVLVNLGEVVPDGFEAFERLIEVVTADEADRQDARARWKHYAARGYNITRHDLGAPGQ